MNPKKLLIGALVLILSSCAQNKTTEQAKFHDDGRPKPIVAIYPIVDCSENNLKWNLADEISNQMRKNIVGKNKLYLMNVDNFAFPPMKSQNLFNESYWSSKEGFAFEYVCLVEIMEHEFTPRDTTKPDKRVSHDLDITLRVKVLDLRGSDPVVVLQEIIHQRNFIPWQFNFINYEKTTPRKGGFSLTPVGLAHRKIIKTVTARIEEYILLSQMNHDYSID